MGTGGLGLPYRDIIIGEIKVALVIMMKELYKY